MKQFYKYQKRLGVSSRSVREGERVVVVIRGEDRISFLPEPLLCHILSFLTTEQAVWTSVLSSRWRYLWKWVPRLELNTLDFTNDQVCVDFIHEFLAFQGEHYLREFKLTIDYDGFKSKVYLYKPCLGRVLDMMRKLERFQFQVENKFGPGAIDDIDDVIRTRLTLSACEALALISCSPVLEDLKICLSKDDSVVALRVCSPSLKSFVLRRAEPFYARGRSVVIDAPKLEYLSLMDYYHFRSFKIISKAESLKVDIDVEFELMSDYLSETKIICNLVKNFSGVKDMTISWKTLEFIYIYPIPKLHDLTRLRAAMCLNASPKLLPIVLESCPNLKHLKLELVIDSPYAVSTRLSTVRLPLVSSLESVEMETPVTEIVTELSLARYFMKNSKKLKKLVLRLNNESTGDHQHKAGVLERLVKYSKRCNLSQFEVLPVVPTPSPWPGYVHVKSNRF
uniref:FBD domain-containing protein n=1 Tax=Brassica campestris TaxID=3711 RepID=M4CRC4_BRACM